MIARELALRAAEMLEVRASHLRQQWGALHKWPAGTSLIRELHDEHVAVALELRRHAGE